METCPACGYQGTIEGDNVTNVETEYTAISRDDYEVVVTLTVASEYFSCPHCGLVLDDHQIMQEAGIEESFQEQGDSSDIPYEGEYGND